MERKQLVLNLPVALHRRLKSALALRGLSITGWLVRLIETALNELEKE